MTSNHYSILGIKASATQEEIKKARRRLANIHHPDKHTTEDAKKLNEEKLKLINLAYEILSNPERRKKYDEVLKEEEILNPASGSNISADQSTASTSVTEQLFNWIDKNKWIIVGVASAIVTVIIILIISSRNKKEIQKI